MTNAISNLPIGVFDSGMGGLTVLRALKQQLPAESFIYLGDTARLPYGTKSADTVLQYARQMTDILINRKIKALVIACNTATTAALVPLQTQLHPLPVIGVVRPGASAVINSTKNNRIAVLATETTIASNAYQQLILEKIPQAMISVRACSVLVALAEEGMISNTVAKEALLHYLSELQDEDTLLLGCTHFPVFRELLTTLLPTNVQIVDSADATASQLQQTLTQLHLLNTALHVGSVHYLVTDSIKRFQTVGEIFLKEVLPIDSIELINVSTNQPLELIP